MVSIGRKLLVRCRPWRGQPGRAGQAGAARVAHAAHGRCEGVRRSEASSRVGSEGASAVPDGKVCRASPAGRSCARASLAGSSTAMPDRRLYSAAMALISYSRRLTMLAERDPDRPVITCGPDSLTRVSWSHRRTGLPAISPPAVSGWATWSRGAAQLVEWFVAAAACWKFGATLQPVLPAARRKSRPLWRWPTRW